MQVNGSMSVFVLFLVLLIPAASLKLFAITGAGGDESILYQITKDENNTFVFDEIGPTGANHIVSISENPVNCELYGYGNDNQTLWKIDTTTGELKMDSAVSYPNINAIPDMEFDENGNLFAWAIGDGFKDELVQLTEDEAIVIPIPPNEIFDKTGLTTFGGNYYLKTGCHFAWSDHGAEWEFIANLCNDEVTSLQNFLTYDRTGGLFWTGFRVGGKTRIYTFTLGNFTLKFELEFPESLGGIAISYPCGQFTETNEETSEGTSETSDSANTADTTEGSKTKPTQDIETSEGTQDPSTSEGSSHSSKTSQGTTSSDTEDTASAGTTEPAPTTTKDVSSSSNLQASLIIAMAIVAQLMAL